MITVKKVRTLEGQVIDYTVPSSVDQTLDAEGRLLLLPGVVDPHICFGTMTEEARNWDNAISSALRGGITTALEIPNPDMPCSHKENLELKREAVDKRLIALKAPIHLFFYANADLQEVEALGLTKPLVKGIIIQMDPDKGESLDDTWERVFQMAAWQNLPIIINGANENRREGFLAPGSKETFLEKALYYAEQQSTRLYVLNVSRKEEIDLIQAGRQRALLIYAETTPEHLFQNEKTQADSLWEALNAGVIETVGSGYHADNRSKDSFLFRGSSYDLLDPIFFLPQLLTASKEGKISIEKIVHLTKFNIQDIYELPEARDIVLVDLEKAEAVQKTGGQQPLETIFYGWPAYTIVQGHVFSNA